MGKYNLYHYNSVYDFALTCTNLKLVKMYWSVRTPLNQIATPKLYMFRFWSEVVNNILQRWTYPTTVGRVRRAYFPPVWPQSYNSSAAHALPSVTSTWLIAGWPMKLSRKYLYMCTAVELVTVLLLLFLSREFTSHSLRLKADIGYVALLMRTVCTKYMAYMYNTL